MTPMAKASAEQAEARIRSEVFEGKYGQGKSISISNRLCTKRERRRRGMFIASVSINQTSSDRSEIFNISPLSGLIDKSVLLL
jgi:hypothetical protein